jgi:hypothetical protein
MIHDNASPFSGADVNVTGTKDKEFPIHSALNSSSARCVKEIIKMYPKQLHTQVGQQSVVHFLASPQQGHEFSE